MKYQDLVYFGYSWEDDSVSTEKEFIEYLKEERKQFARVASHYNVTNHRILRTQIDSLLIAYDQAVGCLSLFDVMHHVCPVCDGRGKGNFEADSQEIWCDSCEGTGKL